MGLLKWLAFMSVGGAWILWAGTFALLTMAFWGESNQHVDLIGIVIVGVTFVVDPAMLWIWYLALRRRISGVAAAVFIIAVLMLNVWAFSAI